MAKGAETSELGLLSALELRRLILSREVSPREVAAACLARIRAIDDRIRSFVTIDEEMVMAMADGVERASEGGRASSARRRPVTPSRTSPIRPASAPPMGQDSASTMCRARDAAVARRLREAGGVLLGKTNTPEFGNRATTAYGLFPGDAESLGPQQDRRRFKWRIGRRGRCLSLPHRRRLRRRRIDQNPVELLRSGRHQAVARPRVECAELKPAGRAHHPWADRANGARRRPHARRHGRHRAGRSVHRTSARHRPSSHSTELNREASASECLSRATSGSIRRS